MSGSDYIIKLGDTFYGLAKRWGGNSEDWLMANPHVNPNQLQVGQKIVFPLNIKKSGAGLNQYAEITMDGGMEFGGEHLDEIEMELAGVQFKVRRVGEARIPHEIHVIMPRAEIRKIQPAGENGPCELQIMLSNVNIVHSPRLTSEGGEQTPLPPKAPVIESPKASSSEGSFPSAEEPR